MRLKKNQILGMDDRNNWNDLQSNFCSVLIVSSLDTPVVRGSLLLHRVSSASSVTTLSQMPTGS